MWRALVAQGDLTAHGAFTLGLAADQHLGAAGEAVDFRLLACDHIRQIVDAAHQMRDFFFQMFHRGEVGSGARGVNPSHLRVRGERFSSICAKKKGRGARLPRQGASGRPRGKRARKV